MRKYYRNIFLLTISIGISINVSAQVKLPPKQSETKTPAKQTSSQTNTNLGEGKHTLKITTNADCYLKIDGEDKGIIRIDDVKKIYLDKGPYLIKATSTENKADVFNYEYNAREINMQATYSIDLQSIINTRLTTENKARQSEQERIAAEKKETENKIAIAREAKETEERIAEKKAADEKAATEKQAEQERINREEKEAEEKNAAVKQTEEGLIFTSKTGEQYNRWGVRVNNEEKEVKESDHDEVYGIAERMPAFPGGDEQMMKFLQNNIKYPATERDNEIEGTVFIKFIVEKDGSVSNAEVLKSISPGLDKEALRVVKLFPNFSPGMQQGKPVRVSFTLPIKFALN